MHALAGVPRSGSTLLANTLSQHPDVYVSGTSALYPCVNALTATMTDSPEVKAQMVNVEGTYERLLAATRAFTDGWYAHRDESVVIDKGRGWLANPALLRELYPAATVIVTVRDPRDVIASMLRQDRATALFHNPIAPTLYALADQAMANDGLVGSSIRLVEDAIHSKLDCVFVRYESFTADPQSMIDKIVKHMELEPFEFDFDHVENVAEDLDELYNGKYPHVGAGKIRPSKTTWQDVMNNEMGELIAGVCPLFMQTFSYMQ